MVMAGAALSGCIAVPHDVDPEIAKSAEAVLPAEEILLTVGPRQFLDTMQEALQDVDPDLDIVEGMTFRDTAFPNGGWTLAEMLTPAGRERVRRELAMDYLLLFGPLQYESGDLEGPNTLAIGMPVAAGFGQVDEESTLSGLIVDLSDGTVVSQVDVTATGSTSFAVWIIVAVGTYAETGESAVHGMASALATEIRGHSDKPQPRIALLAAEAARLWKPIGAGGWTRVASDNGVPVFHVFNECGLEDAQISLQLAYDRAMGLHQAEAWDAAYACFKFVAEAGGESELGADARSRMNTMVEAGLVQAPARDEEKDREKWRPAR